MKRFLIFLTIALIVGGGIFVLQKQREEPPETPETMLREDSEEQISASTKPSKQAVLALIPQILDSQFASQTATHTIANLNQQGGYELIVGAVEDVADLAARPTTATIQIVSLTENAKGFERIARIDYQLRITKSKPPDKSG